MTTKIKAVTSFAHGRLSLHRGESASVTAADAAELEKAGFVTVSKPASDKQHEEQTADDQGEKMEPLTINKMADAVDNKSMSKRK